MRAIFRAFSFKSDVGVYCPPPAPQPTRGMQFSHLWIPVPVGISENANIHVLKLVVGSRSSNAEVWVPLSRIARFQDNIDIYLYRNGPFLPTYE